MWSCNAVCVGVPGLVAGAGAGLMVASPVRPVLDVFTVAVWGGQKGCGQQVLQFGAADRYEVGRVIIAGGLVLEGGGHDQERVGCQRCGRPVVPGGPGADLPLVQARGALSELEVLLDVPSGAHCSD